MPPKYSFVLPAYKATFLRESIDSILNQTYKDFELIIVNDASPEDLTSIVNSYSDKRIQYYINEKNVGGTDLVAQWNHCITYATGEYLILASDDDVYHLDYLEKMNVLVNKYPEVNVFRPRVQSINSLGTIIDTKDLLPEFISQIDLIYLRSTGKISGGIPFYLFKRNELVENRGFINFPTAWFSDDATVIRLAKNGIVTHPEVLFSFRYSDINISNVRNNRQLLFYKLSATEDFYLWYAKELKAMNLADEEDEEKLYLVISHLHVELLNCMEWAVSYSDNEAFWASWRMLKRMESVNTYERILIFSKVFMCKFREKIRCLLIRR